MQITLLHHTPLNVCAHAIRTCWQSFENGDEGGEKDRALIDRVGNKFKHASTLEHLVYTFYIQGVSRALLQELARHRMASPSVKSTRYTLKELKECEPFAEDDFAAAQRFIVLTDNAQVDSCLYQSAQCPAGYSKERGEQRYRQVCSSRILQNRTHLDDQRPFAAKLPAPQIKQSSAVGDQRHGAQYL